MVLGGYYLKDEVHSIIKKKGLSITPEIYNIVRDKLGKRLSFAGIYGLFEEVEVHKDKIDDHDIKLYD